MERAAKRLVFAVMVLACAGTAPMAAQQADSESKVRALEHLWGAAAQLRDIKALETIFDDSLLYVHIDGRLLTKAEVLADTQAVSAVEIVVESSDARTHGDMVIISGVLRLKGVEGGKPYLRRERFVDTWLNKNGSWVCVGTDATPVLH